ncbi:MAG TPA: hypothetical protein VFP80_14145 [Thermoanaerobaculia bacterium]|nr:hypothetical protein [Thermoanaerobaculia bacterium]
MKILATCALALLLSTPALAKDGISISLNSDDSRTELGPRHDVRDARMAIYTRDRSTVLLLLDDTVAMQLTDATLAQMESKKKEKKDPSFLEELVVAGVKLAVGKSVEYPIASIRSFGYGEGGLRVIGADNKPVFTEIKVNGTDVLRDFSHADVARFANAVKAARRN